MRRQLSLVSTLALFFPTLLGACDDTSPPGRLNLALDDGSAFFRLRIYPESPSADLTGKTLFDTGCIQQRSRTYELSNIPVGEGYAVVYEGFPRSPCAVSERLALGFRGGLAVTKDGQPYAHVQVYGASAVTALPEDINLSASAARPVDSCSTDTDCGTGNELCFDDAAPSYWCVPSCVENTDCASIHPRATCDAEAGWCMLYNPYPLNMSEPRALGAAATLASGDVVLFGGLEQEGAAATGPTASFQTTTFPLERFDAKTGLFTAVPLTGDDASPGGEFGFGELGNDRFVAIGGLSRVQLGWGASGLTFDAAWSQALLAQIIVWDLATNTARLSQLGQGQARATVVPLDADSFIAIGGIAPTAQGIEVKKGTLICDISGDLSAGCRGGPTLTTARQSPAVLCLDASCERILVVGGNTNGAFAEVIDRGQNQSTALTTRGLPEKLFGPVLCGFDLVGGSRDLLRADPTVAVRLTLDGAELEGNALAGSPSTQYFSAVAPASAAFGSGAQCHLAGGLSAAGLSSGVVRVGSSRYEPKAQLVRPRFGAQAAVIGSGPLAGAVLVSGGLALPGPANAPELGRIAPVRGAEIYLP